MTPKAFVTRASLRWLFSLPTLSLVSLSGCTATLNETPVSDGNCSADTTVVGCVGDSKGYSCTGTDGPDQSNASLSCSVGTAASGGATLYCCVDVPFASNTCTQASTVVNCGGSAIGFSCQGSGRPDETDSSLVCSQGAPGSAGETLYCCAAYMPSVGTCGEDASVQGCGGSSIGFSCSGTDRPEQVNASLACGQGTPSGGATLYCCDTSATPGGTTTSTCAVDANVPCASPSTGYSCSGGAMPTDADPSLACGQGAAASNGQTGYCCNTATATPGSCVQDASVAGCAANTVGYSCSGTETPAQGDPSLTCSTPSAGNGSTDYCCSNGTVAPAACMPDTTVTGCPGISTGYSCTGNVTPETSTLLCGMAMSGLGGATTFCCTPN